MKLEVGMYVRTIYGNIFKIKNITTIDENGEYYKSKRQKNGVIKTICYGIYNKYSEKIIKASHNIIELIEVGDYVNGEEVTYVTENNYIETMYGEILTSYHNDDIKTILTKEQFENYCYKLGE